MVFIFSEKTISPKKFFHNFFFLTCFLFLCILKLTYMGHHTVVLNREYSIVVVLVLSHATKLLNNRTLQEKGFYQNALHDPRFLSFIFNF